MKFNMPEYEVDTVSKEWLQSELRSPTKSLIVLDCRSSNEFQEGHIRSAVNFSIPSLILKRLATGKIDVTSTIKSRDLKQRIQNAYSTSLFILYNETIPIIGATASSPSTTTTINHQQQQSRQHSTQHSFSTDSIALQQQQQQQRTLTALPLPNASTIRPATTTSANDNSVELSSTGNDATTINVLHRRLKQDGCHVYWLKDGFSSFRDTFPEWCEDDNINTDTQKNKAGHTEQLMGLRSLRISSPHSDSACSSSAESSDCESSTHPQQTEAPAEIIPGLFLGNASHSEDSKALQKYNIKYILNVTPDLPNVYESSGTIKYLQIPITDHGSQDLAVHFPAAIQFIDEAMTNRSAVLVHCLAGVSRSVTVTLAYLMHSRGINFEEAFALVRVRKPDISPNFHFLRQLHSFERQLFEGSSMALRTPLSAQSTDSSYLTPSCDTTVHSGNCGCDLISSSSSSASINAHLHHDHHYHHNFHQQLINQHLHQQAQSDYLSTGIGVSPDSGIEFDRWTPADGTPK